MKGKPITYLVSAVALATLSFISSAVSGPLQPIEQLGKAIFFDHRLSSPPGQACASCHSPDAGWTPNREDVHAGGAVHPGAVIERFSNRKPPSAAYATLSPSLYFDQEEGLFIGGNFWDGRATGWLLGNPAADQAQAPFLNPVEHNNPDAQVVVNMVCAGEYGGLFREVFGKNICNNTLNAYNAIAQAISAFENSSEVNAFSSKYDYYLKDPERYPLSGLELQGLKLFEAENKGNCAACHPSQPGPNGEPPLFTDFSYDNLGIPINPDNPWYSMPAKYNPDGKTWRDRALGGFLRTVPRYAKYAAENDGKHKVSTLRNVDKRPEPGFTKSFGHNGFFKSLKAFVHFYNTRDTLPDCATVKTPRVGENCWPKPEIQVNVNKEELGDLGLSEQEEDAIVAFMKTLTDGWDPGMSE
jgi:cytochrome c peroxidase